MLTTIHNLHHLNLMREIRDALDAGRLPSSARSSRPTGRVAFSPAPIEHDLHLLTPRRPPTDTVVKLCQDQAPYMSIAPSPRSSPPPLARSAVAAGQRVRRLPAGPAARRVFRRHLARQRRAAGLLRKPVLGPQPHGLDMRAGRLPDRRHADGAPWLRAPWA